MPARRAEVDRAARGNKPSKHTNTPPRTHTRTHAARADRDSRRCNRSPCLAGFDLKGPNLRALHPTRLRRGLQRGQHPHAASERTLWGSNGNIPSPRALPMAVVSVPAHASVRTADETEDGPSAGAAALWTTLRATRHAAADRGWPSCAPGNCRVGRPAAQACPSTAYRAGGVGPAAGARSPEPRRRGERHASGHQGPAARTRSPAPLNVALIYGRALPCRGCSQLARGCPHTH